MIEPTTKDLGRCAELREAASQALFHLKKAQALGRYSGLANPFLDRIVARLGAVLEGQPAPAAEAPPGPIEPAAYVALLDACERLLAAEAQYEADDDRAYRTYLPDVLARATEAVALAWGLAPAAVAKVRPGKGAGT